MDFKSSNWLSRNKRKRSDLSFVVKQNSSTNTFDYYFNEDEGSSKRLNSLKDDNDEFLDKLPIDWSLKDCLRFSSNQPFPFEGQFKASEDASGITSFVRCIPTKDQLIQANNLENEKDFFSPNKRLMRTPDCKTPGSKLIDNTSQLDTSHTAELRKFCFTWMYPNLPFIKLFPRIENKTNRKLNLGPNKSKPEQFFKDPKSEFCKQLRDDWYSSLKSLYHLVKARQCPFFYICSNNFTILFRAAGISGLDSMHAIITPTTPGLRTMLKEEGSEFRRCDYLIFF